ncbi:hypothetical protein AB0D62_08765 [Streptomyces massasporeus]|uniref:hypothetical protein n=1 Tax=Streptomyces massasporeus TaxID=67324 RepID=UPI0033C45B66
MTAASVGLAVSVVVTLGLLTREQRWMRRLGWTLMALRLCLLSLFDLMWVPAMSPYVSLW